MTKKQSGCFLEHCVERVYMLCLIVRYNMCEIVVFLNSDFTFWLVSTLKLNYDWTAIEQ